jgi:polysaccharide export outer membrane protein
MLRWIRIAIAVGSLLTIASEAGAAEFGNPASGDAAYLWSGSFSDSKSQGAGNGATPSSSSAKQMTSNRGSSSAATVRDPSVKQAADKLTATVTPGDSAYKIGPLDVLDISVFQAPELTKTVTVASNGTIDFPLLGEVPVAGKSTYQLQKELNAKLGAKYLQNPQVTVTVAQFNASRVTVSGAVKNPGVFPYKGETLLQFVTMAGGLSDDALNTVVVLRQSNGTRSAAKFNIADIEAGRLTDPPMEAGDLVVADSNVVKKGFNTVLAPIMKVLPLALFAGL